MHEPRGVLLENIPLRDYSSWQAGGFAKCLYKPNDREDLCAFLKHLPDNEPLLWLGLGSNTLIRDGGFSGTVIITQGALNNLQLNPPCAPLYKGGEQFGSLYKGGELVVQAEAGVACATLARYCARQNLSGLEFLAGIPGTVGGALRMNAGCFNGQTWDNILSVETIDRHGTITIETPADFSIAYRHVAPNKPAEKWFLSGTFQLKPGEKQASLDMIKTLLDRRAQTQPINEANCGSVFRNPPGDFAARLIEHAGLKGHRIGGAQVSTKHANFIINDGSATAADIEQLISIVHQSILETTGISLIREVHIVGDA